MKNKVKNGFLMIDILISISLVSVVIIFSHLTLKTLHQSQIQSNDLRSQLFHKKMDWITSETK
ncbi:MAG: hypothetical protein ACKVQC_03940 [Elusimicrobiota bacterium]